MSDTRLFRFNDTNVGLRGLVLAASAGKARYLVVKAATEADYNTTFRDVRISRASDIPDRRIKRLDIETPHVLSDYEIGIIKYAEASQ